jgi:hypothetical protein
VTTTLEKTNDNCVIDPWRGALNCRNQPLSLTTSVQG